MSYYFELFKQKYNRQTILTDLVRQNLLDYSWPGNVRKLEHIVEQIVIMNEGITEPQPLSFGADMVFYKGKILTMDGTRSIVQAMAVKGNQVVYTGDEDDLNCWIGPDTLVYDLSGKCLLPRFIDAHAHFGGWGLNETAILGCSAKQAASI